MRNTEAKPSGAFLADPLLNSVLTAPDEDLHVRRIMDEGKVLLVNLSRVDWAKTALRCLAGFW